MLVMLLSPRRARATLFARYAFMRGAQRREFYARERSARRWSELSYFAYAMIIYTRYYACFAAAMPCHILRYFYADIYARFTRHAARCFFFFYATLPERDAATRLRACRRHYAQPLDADATAFDVLPRYGLPRDTALL